MEQENTSNGGSRAKYTAIRITAAYLVVGVLWILFSDKLLGMFIEDPARIIRFQILKGWLYVLATSYMLYVLIYWSLASKERSDQVLRESEDRYRTLVESTSDAILLTDRERRILSCNNAFLSLFGFERDEVEGQSISIIHPSEESFQSFGKLARDEIKRGNYTRIEWELRRKDGTVFPTEETCSAIRNPSGKVVGYVAIIRDITERKRSEEELKRHRDHLEEMVHGRTRDLEEAQKALLQREKLKTLGAISAEVAHEIRNPLVSIGGFARRLKKKYPDSAEAEIILSESRRLESILDRLISYLRPVDMRPQQCSANSVLTECLSLLSPEIEQEKVALHLDLNPAISYAFADPAILCEVLINLIRSAVSDLKTFATLSIRSYETEHYVQIDLKAPLSSGKGRDPEMLFLPFEQGGRSGIGVPISFRLLRDMGGLLFFSQENSISTFTIAMPRYTDCQPGSGVECDRRADHKAEDLS